MRLSDLKASDKLPRGSYFYITVGHLYYSGQHTEMIEVPVVKPTWYPAEKGPKRRRHFAYSYRPENARLTRDRRKKTTATYLSRVDVKPKIDRVQTPGKTSPVLSDDFAQVKQFRKKEQIENACKMLEAMYGKTGAKIGVHYKGDTK